LQHIAYIIENAEDSKLNDEFYQKTKPSIRMVAKTMNLTPAQALIFSLFMEKSDDNNIHLSEISGFLGCQTIKAIGMMNDIEELERRRLIRCRREKSSRWGYRIPREVIHAVNKGVAYQPRETKNLSIEDLFIQMELLFEERSNNEISGEVLLDDLKTLIHENPSLAFCRQIQEYEKLMMRDEDYLLLLLFCHRFINLDDDSVCFSDFDDLYDTKRQFKKVKSELMEGHYILIDENILEYANDDGFGDRESFKINSLQKEKLFSELHIKVKQAENKRGLILHDKITGKDLFYNEREQSQIGQLSALLQPENFASVAQKLEKNGMRKGFACLFYGAPGTGKTETVYQIARATGRDIMQVDISETKSMWFGESEKRIKEIFERYRAFVKSRKIAPILLFNEADAVIGKRKDVATGAVAQTENAIQNIILQEMENLEGIMIATTNLTQNLDKAFERRFLYKIEFEKPEVEAKKSIWRSMMPSLSESEALQLANSYDFSGGQIENISRKRTVSSIIGNEEPSFGAILDYCRDESFHKGEVKRKIGYR